MKRYMNAALLYAVLAMAGGVFYREFTKFTGFTAKTTLSVIHTHYFMLGMAVFFCCCSCWKRTFSFTGPKTGRILAVYHTGLNDCPDAGGPGNPSVLGTPLSSSINAAISGVAGIGHILLGTGLVLFIAPDQTFHGKIKIIVDKTGIM